MKNQKGSGLIAVLAILGVLIALGGFFAMNYIKYHNIGVQYEQRLKGVWSENTVVLNTYTTKVQEVAQVPGMYKEDLSSVIKDTFSGRYGKDGSKAVVQFIQEQNMNLDPSMYRQIQQVMEAGRNEFQTSQKMLIDVKMNYEAQLGYFWSGLWLGFAGYPKVNLDDYKILKTADVEAKMESGVDSVIKLR